MELKTGQTILALMVFALRQQIIFAQNDCRRSGKQVDVSAFYNTTLTSPNYPSEYDRSSVCVWQLSAESGFVLKVVFNDFKLTGGFNNRPVSNLCPVAGSLIFGDAFTSSSSELGRYCSTAHPEVIFSTGRYLYIQFTSDDWYVAKGFNISVSAVKKEKSYGSCRLLAGKEYWPFGSSGTLYTPDYPVPYPDGTTCIWTISVPLGRRVKLTFEYFELGRSSFIAGYGHCKYDKLTIYRDYVEIRDGAWSDSRELGSFCGNKLDFEFYSTGRHMWVKFQSIFDEKKEYKGFKAHFEAVDSPIFSEELCLPGNPNNYNLKLTGSEGTLQSPLKYYPPDMRCNWVITVPEGNIVKLSFDRFELGYYAATSACKGDYVEVLDGKYGESKGRFCGYKSPIAISSSDRYMWVRFTSDSKGPVYRGFKATFTAIKKSRMRFSTITSDSKGLTVAVIILGVVLFLVLACLVVCLLKRRRALNSKASVRVPISTITSRSHTVPAEGTEHSDAPSSLVPDQLAATSHTTPRVGNAPVPTDPPLPHPTGLPPPYSQQGELQLQFPLSGESYPLQQSAQIQDSTPPESTFKVSE